jgi:uncharacterized protein (TIGR02271 family)
MTLDSSTARELEGCEIVDEAGEQIGKVDEIYLDDDTGQAEFALIKAGGLFGSKSHFVPLQNAAREGDRLRVPYAKDKVKDAPGWEGDEHLSQQQEQEIYRYYGLAYGERRSESGLAEGGRGDDIVSAGRGEAARTGRGDVRGGTTDDAMTRSEEEMAVATTGREAGRARLRKWVESDTVSETVPVSRERARVEREPIGEQNRDAALRGPDISEGEHEVTLKEEQPVVEKRTVPKERVRLDKDTVTEEREVSGVLRRERIEVEGDVDPTDDRRG